MLAISNVLRIIIFCLLHSCLIELYLSVSCTVIYHSEGIAFSSEQDRGRLRPVATRLVELGADLAARDAEGRTALHLAAGCGDKQMTLLLVELGSDVNCRDSVGGECASSFSFPHVTKIKPQKDTLSTK